jgi:glycosyltransferase involved in cell wall biosynthesis
MTCIVSIIVPNFNKGSYIAETLESVINQDFAEWEIICIDDGSTDDSLSIIQKYAKSDNRIKLHKREREPKGANTCRNIGISKANGDFIMFLDSDDLIGSRTLSNRIAFQKKNGECAFTVFKMMVGS